MRCKHINDLPEYSVNHDKYCFFCGDHFFTNKNSALYCENACTKAYHNITRSYPELKEFTNFGIPISRVWRHVAAERLIEHFGDDYCGCGCHVNNLNDKEIEECIQLLKYPPFDNHCLDCKTTIICSILAGNICISDDEDKTIC
jgi:hypothetical protein